MIAYRYDQDGIFLEVISAQKNPKKSGEFLLPYSCTFIAPPTGYTEDKIPSFNEITNQWVLVDSPIKIAQDQDKLRLTNEHGVNLYEADQDGKPVLKDISVVEAETNEAIKQKTIEALKLAMDANIFIKAKEVTKGSSMESVQAFISSYQLRAANASEYVNDGLKVHYTYGAFTQGDTLATESTIRDYYTSLLIYLDKFREAEIQNYLLQKAAL